MGRFASRRSHSIHGQDHFRRFRKAFVGLCLGAQCSRVASHGPCRGVAFGPACRIAHHLLQNPYWPPCLSDHRPAEQEAICDHARLYGGAGFRGALCFVESESECGVGLGAMGIAAVQCPPAASSFRMWRTSVHRHIRPVVSQGYAVAPTLSSWVTRGTIIPSTVRRARMPGLRPYSACTMERSYEVGSTTCF